MIFLVTYLYDGEATEQLATNRPAHREFLGNLHQAGSLLASGPWVDGGPGAFLVMQAEDSDAVFAILDDDPFQIAGLILSRTAQSWNPLIGNLG